MSDRYDRAITVFSPDGHLFQVEYAQEAVKKGATVVGVRGKNIICLGVEKKAVANLQDDRTVRKIAILDDNVVMAFAGLTADARVLIQRARVECQSHKLTVEEPVTAKYIARHIAELKQKYTQSNGRRPFGLSTLIAGFDTQNNNECHLFLTDPSGTYHEWKANAIGKNDKTVREKLEQKYPKINGSEEECINLVIEALQEVTQGGSECMEIVTIIPSEKTPIRFLSQKEIQVIIQAKKDAEEEEAAKEKK